MRDVSLATAAVGAAGSLSPSSYGAAGKTVGEAFDTEILSFMKARKTPGASVAIIKDRRLVYTAGYGFADLEKKEAPRPESLFRIASVSKPFTAVAILQLVAAGRLEMDAPAFAILGLKPLAGMKTDPRMEHITVRHLLHHTGGWDRDKSGDPMFMSQMIAIANGEHPPANQHAIIRYMLGVPLDFNPGERYAYSNFGYCTLGRIIEKITGRSYNEYMQKEVLSPIGIRRMRLGMTAAGGRADGEVKYYMPGRGSFADDSQAEPYTGFCLEAMDSHGAWLASAVDLARFAAALQDPSRTAWLPASSRVLLDEPPAPPAARTPEGALHGSFYACGLQVDSVGHTGSVNRSHNGSLPGTATMLMLRHDDVAWAILFNQRSTNDKLPDKGIKEALQRATAAVTEWPSHDLFDKYV